LFLEIKILVLLCFILLCRCSIYDTHAHIHTHTRARTRMEAFLIVNSGIYGFRRMRSLAMICSRISHATRIGLRLDLSLPRERQEGIIDRSKFRSIEHSCFEVKTLQGHNILPRVMSFFLPPSTPRHVFSSFLSSPIVVPFASGWNSENSRHLFTILEGKRKDSRTELALPLLRSRLQTPV